MESPGILTTAQLLLATMAASQKHLLPVPHNNHSFVLMDGHLSPSPTIKDAASAMNVNVRCLDQKVMIIFVISVYCNNLYI